MSFYVCDRFPSCRFFFCKFILLAVIFLSMNSARAGTVTAANRYYVGDNITINLNTQNDSSLFYLIISASGNWSIDGAGKLTGSSNPAGSYTISYNVFSFFTNGAKRIGTYNVNLVIADPLTATLLNPSINLKQNQSAAIDIVDVSGGFTPNTYSMDPSTPLPQGLSLTGTGSKISITGTPSALTPNKTYKLIVKDSYQAISTIPFDLQVTPVLISQTIAVAANVNPTPFNTSVTLSSMGTSGIGSVSYAIVSDPDNACSISASTLTASKAASCSVTATIMADSTYDTATSTPLRVTFTSSDQVITYSGPTAGVVGQTGTLSATANSQLSGFTYTSTTPLICSVDQVTKISFLASGVCAIKIDLAGNANWKAASLTVNITSGKAPTTVTLSVSNAAPVLGTKVTLSAVVVPSVATGSVTFKDGSTTFGAVSINNGVASLATNALPLGASSLVATYSGDVNYNASTSNVVAVTANRSNPVTNIKVKSLLSSQTSTIQRVLSLQTSVVQRRLELLHEPVSAFTNGITFVEPRNGSALAYAPLEKTSLASNDRYGALAAIDRQIKPRDVNESRSVSPSLPATDYAVWTSGQITVGENKIDGLTEKLKSTTQSIGLRLDRQIQSNWKVGVAVGVFTSRDTLDQESTKNRSMSWTGSLYQSWNVFDKFYLDGMIGYGDIRMKSKRFDSNAGDNLFGERTGNTLSGSLTAAWDERFGAFRVSPYATYDWSKTWLAASSETGPDLFALTFDQASYASNAIVLGVHGQYDFVIDQGIISPTLRLEMRHTLDGVSTQTLSYTADPQTTYLLTASPKARQSYTAGLGLKASGAGSVTGQLEYLMTTATGAAYVGQGLRGTLRVGF